MVSVIMPAYNADKFISQAIQSVQKQTVKDWELIVVDDDSLDHTRQLIEAHAKDDPRIKAIYHSKNRGVSCCRNEGVRKASGEWIAFLDSDDCWREDKLERQLAYAKDYHADFLYTASAFMNESGKLKRAVLHVPLRMTYQQLLKQNLISCSSVLIRKSMISRYPMKHAATIHEDFATWLELLREEKCVAYGIDEPLLIYRIRAQSKSGNKIKAAKMTFHVYQSIGLPIRKQLYYWCCYVMRSIKKYCKICL